MTQLRVKLANTFNTGGAVMKKLLCSLFIIVAMAAGLMTSDAAAQGYRIKPGDSLQIEVLEDASLNRRALVLPDGSINMPIIGSVPAAGSSVSQLRSNLASRLAPNFATTPTVFVSVDALAVPTLPTGIVNGRDIFITGEVTTPGKLLVSSNATILQAIAEAGGLTRFAAGKRIQLRRGGNVYNYNYYTNTGNVALQAGDVIVIPQRKLFE